MKRRIAAALLICGTLPLTGCFIGREFSTFADETAEQVRALDLVSFDVSYMGDLNRNSTRSEQDAFEIVEDVESIWGNHIAHYAPPPTGYAPRGEGSYSVPRKAAETMPPPKKTEIDRIENSDIFIIRSADGEITVTNKADQK